MVVSPGPVIEARDGPLARAVAGSARTTITISASFFTAYWMYTLPGALVPDPTGYYDSLP
jgi:hypothetical protein